MLVDLSIPLENSSSEREPVEIQFFDHAFGGRLMSEIFGVPQDALPDGSGWAGELVSAITHAGTHMDAPYHYGPTANGQPAWKICDVPLDWCTGNGTLVDMRKKNDGEKITADDLAATPILSGRTVLSPVVLVWTGASRFWGEADYPDRGAGLTAGATAFLVNRGVRVIGIDAWGLDRPFSSMRSDFRRTGDIGSIWPAHYFGRSRPYLQLEKLTNLDLLPEEGFRVFAFPIKISGAGAAWCRVVAECQ